MRECDLIAMNPRCPKQKGELWTLEYPNGEKPQLDFVMRNSASNCEAYSTFSTVGSDHRIATAKVRRSLRARNTANKNVRCNWGMLLENNNVVNRCNLEVCNRFQLLMEKVENDSANNVYKNVVTVHEESFGAPHLKEIQNKEGCTMGKQ